LPPAMPSSSREPPHHSSAWGEQTGSCMGNESVAMSTCPGCGVLLPHVDGPSHPYMLSSAACWATYGEVLARSFEDSQLRRVHQLLVDAFAVQHPGLPGRRSAQSVGLHLMTLCLVLEMDADPSDGPRLHKRMAERPVFHWLEPPSSRGDVTVADVHAANDVEDRIAATYRWARSAWEAWTLHHATVRAWLLRAT
jgi:hypothetical protein